jgi:hypothetical protein
MAVGGMVGSVIIAVVILVLLLVVITRLRRRSLVSLTIGFFVCGVIALTMLYSYSYMSAMDAVSGPEYFGTVMRAFYYAGKSFLGEDDFSGISDALGENGWLAGLFFVLSIAAIAAAALAIIAVAGRELTNKLRMRVVNYRERYIILGASKKAVILGESIAKRGDRESSKTDRGRLIVFMTDNATKELTDSVEDFDGIVVEYSPDALNRHIRLAARKYFLRGPKVRGIKGALLSLCYAPQALLSRLKSNPPAKCHLVIASDSEAETMMLLDSAAETISRSTYEISPAGTAAGTAALRAPAWITLHVITDSLMIEKKIDRLSGDHSLPFNLNSANEAEILIRNLLLRYPPYKILSGHFADPDPGGKITGRCDKVFTVVIVGFGRTGETALRHLAMNGQFLGVNGETVGMRAALVDKDMDILKDSFVRRYPEFEKCCRLEYVKAEVRSAGFYEVIEKLEAEHGSGKSDDTAIDLIMICLNDDRLELMAMGEIADYYRRDINQSGMRPLLIANLTEGVAVLRKGADGDEDPMDFIPHNESLYSESTVIRSAIDAQAMAINYRYEDDNNKKDGHGNALPPETLWNRLNKFKQDSNRAAADFIPAMIALAGVELPGKDPERNAVLKEIAGQDNILDCRKDLSEPERKELQGILADTEHRRWSAFHYASGYSRMSLDEMRNYAYELNAKARSEGKKAEDIAGAVKGCRENKDAGKHALLAPTAELDALSKYYNELVEELGKDLGIKSNRDFREDDEKIVSNIPKFLYIS